MTKLHQLAAILKSTKDAANKETAPVFHTAKAPAEFVGLTRTYEPLDDEGESLPDESTRVKATVPEMLERFRRPMTRLFDLVLTIETSNMKASADVVVDGDVIIKDAPVTFLMQFEKMLQQEVRGLIVSLPTLDPAQDWELSTSERQGIYETSVVKRHRTKKVNKPIVLSPATDKFPAQTQMVIEDMLAGHWNEKKFSGAVTGARKQELVERVDKLINAVKMARESANDQEVEDKTAGADIFGYLLS